MRRTTASVSSPRTILSSSRARRGAGADLVAAGADLARLARPAEPLVEQQRRRLARRPRTQASRDLARRACRARSRARPVSPASVERPVQPPAPRARPPPQRREHDSSRTTRELHGREARGAVDNLERTSRSWAADDNRPHAPPMTSALRRRRAASPHWGVIRARGADAATLPARPADQRRREPRRRRRRAWPATARRRAGCRRASSSGAPRADEFLLACSADLLAPTLKRLSMFVLRAKCKLSDASAEVAAVRPRRRPARARCSASAASGQARRRTARDAASACPMPPASRAASGAGPPTRRRCRGPALSPRRLAAGSRCRAASPRIDAATVDQFVPQMVNFELVGGVNFQKGCYPGQEVVARSQYRGTMKRRTFLFDCDAAAGRRRGGVRRTATPGEPAGMVVERRAAPAATGGSALVEVRLAAVGDGPAPRRADGPPLRRRDLPYAVRPRGRGRRPERSAACASCSSATASDDEHDAGRRRAAVESMQRSLARDLPRPAGAPPRSSRTPACRPGWKPTTPAADRDDDPGIDAAIEAAIAAAALPLRDGSKARATSRPSRLQRALAPRLRARAASRRGRCRPRRTPARARRTRRARRTAPR